MDTFVTLSHHSFVDEAQHVNMLLQHTQRFESLVPAIHNRARSYVDYLRSGSANHALLESFLQQYGLNTKEGIALMGLAEALLRIPDAETANHLIRGQFKEADWQKYMGNSDSLFVNAASWGLLFSSTLMDLNDHPRPILSRLLGRMGEPVIRTALKQAMRLLGDQFVLGETIESALINSEDLLKQHFLFSYDMLGEGARSEAQAQSYYESYLYAIRTLAASVDERAPLYKRPSISVKLSALDPRYHLTHYDSITERLLPRLKAIISLAKEHGIAVTIDAEEANRLELSLLLLKALLSDPAFNGWDGIGLAVQAYQKRAWYVIEHLKELAVTYNHRIGVRLVKGAYWDSEIKYAQVNGLDGYPVFTRKLYTDVSYLACAEKLLAHPQLFYPQFATHNAYTVAAIKEMAGDQEYEFQRLYGMGKALYHKVCTDEGTPCRVYAPVGKHEELLPYLIRRLLENGSSASFIHALGDEAVSNDMLIENPIATARALEGAPHPTLPLPAHIYSTRRNSRGINMGSTIALAEIQQGIASYHNHPWYATPLIPGRTSQTPTVTLSCPFDTHYTTGSYTSATADDAHYAITLSTGYFPRWSGTSTEERAAMLERIADAFEAHRDELIALCIYEAGKTIADGVAEIREAVDFCRYYASLARRQLTGDLRMQGPTGEYNGLSLHGRGTFICISPWNFPLAIFTGQITAALVSGNCVIAKPAEQTPLIAYRAVQLMHDAGVPKEALQLVIGSGETVGAALTSDARIGGVAFTGSTATARAINLTLAKRHGPIVPLIAETGGQNAMIVDSTALLEAAVDDIILSAFGSAGQRCSALRVLYVQDDIADRLITLLTGAMQELHMGPTHHITTDLGPVIDHSAYNMLSTHIARMKREATFIAAAPALAHETGYFIAPHAFEIPDIHLLKGEVFGPVLHVIRYKASNLDTVLADINSTGYGLTLGIHSRVDTRIRYIRDHAHVGNMYVNRSMIGATVGVQPFGGEGLSGTGPKAGGPHYLLRFTTERSFTYNLTAIGGNIELMS